MGNKLYISYYKDIPLLYVKTNDGFRDSDLAGRVGNEFNILPGMELQEFHTNIEVYITSLSPPSNKDVFEDDYFKKLEIESKIAMERSRAQINLPD